MRRNRLFWGSLVLLAGIILLMDTMGILPRGINGWQIIWPLALILAGFYFLLGPTLFKQDLTVDRVEIPLEGAQDVEIRMDYGAGYFHMSALEMPGTLLEGSFAGGLEHQMERRGPTAFLRMRSKITDVFDWPHWGGERGLEWNFAVSRDAVYHLIYNGGASESVFDLTDLQVRDLEIHTGASKTEVSLPNRVSLCRVSVEHGAAAVTLRVPADVAARVTVEGAAMGTNINTARFLQSGNVYQSPNYDSAEYRAEISVKGGMGSIEVI
ncbi:MAG: cell wall-active antibiotics response protein [Chloroflexi bacterium]|nr:cell wall-active antibiotics response protein [Chloroflexota bacterium]